MAVKTREERLRDVLDAFIQEFPSLEEARKDLGGLTEARSAKKAVGRKGHWYQKARVIFGKEERGGGESISWYDILARLVMNASWFENIDDARAFCEEVRNQGRETARAKVLARCKEKREKRLDVVLAAFKKAFPSLEYARNNLDALREGNVRPKKGERGHFYYQAIQLFSKVKGRVGSWHDDALPELMLRAGWFRTLDEAKAFADASRETSRKKSKSKRRSMVEQEIITAFVKEFLSLEKAKADLGRLSAARARKIGNGAGANWFFCAANFYKKTGGKTGSWYSDALPWLAFRAGWFDSIEKAREFGDEVRNQAVKTRGHRACRLSEAEVVGAFVEEFKSLETVRKNLGRLSADEVKDMGWYNPARSLFKGSRGGKPRPGSWYGDILPKLVVKAGWFKTIEEAQGFSKSVEAHYATIAWRRITEKRLKKRDVRLIEEFRKDFPSLDEVRWNPARLGEGRVCNRRWHSAAVRVFRGPDNKRRGNWYTDILPYVMMKAGWFTGIAEAKAFGQEVKKRYRQQTYGKSAAPVRTESSAPPHPAKSDSKMQRKYAIVIATLRSARGASFEGISSCLSLDATAANTNGNGNGMARAVVIDAAPAGRQLTPGELVRLNMMTENWGGDLAEAYASAFAYIAPYLTTRLLMLHMLRLSKERTLPELNEGASFMSGPGEVYGALQDLRAEIEKGGMNVPKVVDVDAEKDMLNKSKNPIRLLSVLPDSPLAPGSLDFVECSSLYQFNPRKHPTIARDTLTEAARVLKYNGALILTSTVKRFSATFEEGLRKLGFDIVAPANTRLELSEETKAKVAAAMGEEVLGKAVDASKRTYHLIAIKSARPGGDAPAGMFGFERPKAALPEEARTMATQARRFDRDRKASTEAAVHNMGSFAAMMERLEPDSHERNAVLIQTILSKYLLDPKVRKPECGPDELLENAGKIAEEVRWANGTEKEKYYIYLRRAAETHRAKLDASARTRRASTCQAKTG
ncbi:MAG: hypothetical protein V1861_06675 [Candidatus Micrarchaeota archaeon]